MCIEGCHLQRALRFYAGVLGMEVMQRYGDGAVFLSAGGYHHHIAVEIRGESGRVRRRRVARPGLYHTAIVYPTRAALATALPQSAGGEDPLQGGGAADHGVSESIYLQYPDENGVSCTATSPRKNGRGAADGKIGEYTRRWLA